MTIEVSDAANSGGQHLETSASGNAARLTISKLVLINFKSYAGRQEIGPFHKVPLDPHRFQHNIIHFSSSHLVRLSVQMAPENQMSLMLCFLYLDSAPRKCDREN
jgi:hypothetical protein